MLYTVVALIPVVSYLFISLYLSVLYDLLNRNIKNIFQFIEFGHRNKIRISIKKIQSRDCRINRIRTLILHFYPLLNFLLLQKVQRRSISFEIGKYRYKINNILRFYKFQLVLLIIKTTIMPSFY